MRGAGLVLVLVLALLASACTSSAETETAPTADRITLPPVVEVAVDGIRTHLEVLQGIADGNGGTRVIGSPGYEASVDYVVGVLRDAGYEVALAPVNVPVFAQGAPTVLERVEPTRQAWVDDVDLRAMLFSASTEVRAHVTAAEGGCGSSDLAGFPEGDVALLNPGPCLRREQVVNAQDAGAAAVIFPDPDTAAGRPLRPTLLYPDGIEVPVLAVTPEVGDALAPDGGEGSTVHIQVDASSTWTETASVIAQTPSGDPGRIVVLGAHLDSVMDGPGINDNGSGVAMLLEIARWLASREADATVRFAFWAGEEEGLYGSRDYVQALSDEDVEAMIGYLNLDMVASPNFVRYVVADSAMVPAAGEGTATIRRLFSEYFEERGLAVEPVETFGAADHGSFATAGIPVGGLFAGSAHLKTPEQAQAHGGRAGELMDACYHQACDMLENVSDVALEQFTGAYVAVLTELARVA